MPWPKGVKQPPEMVEKRKATCARPDIKAKMGGAFRGQSLSEEHKARISQSLKGHEVTSETREMLRQQLAGKPHSPERIAKLREAIKAKWAGPVYRMYMEQVRKTQRNGHRKGAVVSPEARVRMRRAHLGKRRTLESRFKQGRSIAGEKHHAWRGGTLPSGHRGLGWYVVKRLVLERADNHCELCGIDNRTPWKLDVHHIIPYRDMPVSVEWACLGLCRRCHVRADRGLIDTSTLQETLRSLLQRMLP